MPAAVLQFPSRTSQAQFCILELAHPGEPRVAIGVLRYDESLGELEFRIRRDFRELDITEEDEEYLEALADDFSLQIRERGGQAVLAQLEDSLSNFILISEREPAGQFGVDALYERYVDSAVRAYETHLPVFTLQAAASKFGEDAEVEESGWRRVDGLRLAQGMFVAQVVGRSMEPLIPDGSFCVFRSPVVGSRQGKRLLIEQLGVTESSARYTVKRYTSVKRQSGEEWEHAAIRLEPLNPEFPAFDLQEGTFRVLGEFVRVLPA